MWEWAMAYLALGAFVGFFAGLLGVGGGGMMVPVLTTFFVAQNFGVNAVHMALATSMTSIVITSFSSAWSHQKRGAVLWPVVVKMSPFIMLGSFLGAFVTEWLSSFALAVIFCSFMSYVALQMLLNIKPNPSRELPGAVGLRGVGFVIGSFSALVSIGGGALTVPFLTWCNVKVQQAIATSAAIGVPLSIAGSIGYLIAGSKAQDMPDYSVGYLYLPAAICISVVSSFTAPLGATLAHRLPVATLKKVFAALLVALSLKMLHSVVVAL